MGAVMTIFELLSVFGAIVVPFVIYAMAAQSKRSSAQDEKIATLEARQFEMKGDLVTKDELTKAEERITHNMDLRISDLGGKLEVIISQNQWIMSQNQKAQSST